MFSLSNKESLKPFKVNVRKPKYAIYRTSSYGPRFGRSNIVIADPANKLSHADLATTTYPAPSGVRDPQTILAGSNNFTPDDWEVFYLA